MTRILQKLFCDGNNCCFTYDVTVVVEGVQKNCDYITFRVRQVNIFPFSLPHLVEHPSGKEPEAIKGENQSPISSFKNAEKSCKKIKFTPTRIANSTVIFFRSELTTFHSVSTIGIYASTDFLAYQPFTS